MPQISSQTASDGCNAGDILDGNISNQARHCSKRFTCSTSGSHHKALHMGPLYLPTTEAPAFVLTAPMTCSVIC